MQDSETGKVRKEAIFASLALVAAAALGMGAFWFKQQRVEASAECVVAGPAPVPSRLKNIVLEDNGMMRITGGDPYVILPVPAGAGAKACLLVELLASKADILQVFMPGGNDPAYDGFSEENSVKKNAPAGITVFSIPLPANTPGRNLRLDPSIGATGTAAIVTRFGIGRY